MFGLGMGEILVILVLALLLLGPSKLPDAAKQLGKGLREFRRATDDLKSQFDAELYSEEARRGKPTLVEPPTPAGTGAGTAAPAPVPAPDARADNVPGLDAALAEPEPRPPPSAEPAPKGS
jgi:sec-independent protein translocase protein TatB